MGENRKGYLNDLRQVEDDAVGRISRKGLGQVPEQLVDKREHIHHDGLVVEIRKRQRAVGVVSGHQVQALQVDRPNRLIQWAEKQESSREVGHSTGARCWPRQRCSQSKHGS